MSLLRNKNLVLFILVLFMAVIILNFALTQTAYASIFDGKYGKSQVFNVSRMPAYPTANQSFRVYNFRHIYNAETLSQLSDSDWGTNGDRYIAFVGAGLAMNLYEANGTLVETLSSTGTIRGLGTEGFLYESHNGYGYFITNHQAYEYGFDTSITYTPYTGLATPQEIADYPTSGTPIELPDTTAPTATPSTITVTGLSSSSVNLEWTEATDDKSAQEDLEYLAYYSTSDNIDTVADMESNGTAVGSYAADIAVKNVTSIVPNTTYYYNVIVKDEMGNQTAYTAQSHEIAQYTITYHLDGGVNSGSNPSTYLTADTPITLEAATKDSCTFKGWYTEAEFTNKVTQIANGSTTNIELWAKWEIDVSSVTLDKENETLDIGDTLTLVATVVPSNATNPDVMWTSSNETVATVDSSGKVTAVAAGSTTITATADGKSDTCTITVADTQYTITYHLDGGVNSGSNPSTYLTADTPITLEAATKDGCTFEGWYTEAEFTNKVTEIADGSSTDIELWAKWEIDVSSVTLDKENETLDIGDTLTLVATVVPNNATNSDVTWTSSDETVATVDSSGKVTAVTAGSATITATADGKSDTCTITVEEPIPAGTQYGTISTIITDSAGNPIVGAKVELHSNVVTGVTDSSGKVTFSNVPLVNHTLVVFDDSDTEIGRIDLDMEKGSSNGSEVSDSTIDVTYTEDAVSVEVAVSVLGGAVSIEEVTITENPATGDSDVTRWIMLSIALSLGCAAVWIFQSRKKTVSDQ